MTLSEKDGKLYYQLWLPLLDYVNHKYRVRRNLKEMANATSLEPQDVKAVANKLYEDIGIIDEYLALHSEIPEEHKTIVAGWKKSISGKFIIERHLKKGSIFISAEDEKVYQVVGIITSIEEMFWSFPMPLMVEATLMPFNDMIITDGLIMPYNVVIGSNMKKMFKDIYMAAKTEGQIVKNIM